MDLKERSENLNRHPWELSRADIVLDLIKEMPKDARYADIGSGDLYFARRLSDLTGAPVYAVDVHYGTPGVEDGISVCTDLSQVPSDVVDCAVLMDVLEHVDDDVGFVAASVRILRPGGTMLITVPAHSFLWSEHDVFLGHHRRYDVAGLRAVLTRGGLEVAESFYFYAGPFVVRTLAVALARIGFGGPKPGVVASWPYPVQHPMTRAVRALLNGDFKLSRLLGRTVASGCGLSICAICRRRSA